MRFFHRAVLFTVVLSAAMVGCRQKDYYTAIQNDHTCIFGQRQITPACRASILAHAPIDQGSFADHPEILEGVIDGIYKLMSAPIQFPKEKKMAASATLEEAGMYDFIERIANAKNSNQALVNYVLNSAPVIKYGCSPFGEETAHYEPSGIQICSSLRDEIRAMSILLHEARHSETGPHDMFCPEDNSLISECDIGFDGPLGWEIGLFWGLVQGTNLEVDKESFFKRKDLVNIAFEIQIKVDRIYGFPPSLQGTILEDRKRNRALFSYVERLPWLEELRTIPTYPTLQMVPWQLEQSGSQEAKVVDVLAADWDGDGKQELCRVLQNEYPHKVSFQIYKGSLDNTLVKKSSYERAGEYAWAVRKIDWNHDLYPDLVYVFNEGFVMNLAILQNKRDGSFELVYKTSDYYFSYPDPKRIEVVDVDQDGHQDIVAEVFSVASPGQKSIRVFFREGMGFQSVPVAILRSPTSSYAFAVGDLTQDGIPDILFGTYDDEINLVAGKKDRTFPSQQTLPIRTYKTTIYQIDQIELVDINDDGFLDLFLDISDPDTPRFRNKIGFFTKHVPTSPLPSFEFDSVSAINEKMLFADVNRDQILDQFSLQQYTSLIRYGTPSSGWTFSFDLDLPEEQETTFTEEAGKDNRLLHADLNSDGWEDIIIFDQRFVVLWNQGLKKDEFVW